MNRIAEAFAKFGCLSDCYVVGTSGKSASPAGRLEPNGRHCARVLTAKDWPDSAVAVGQLAIGQMLCFPKPDRELLRAIDPSWFALRGDLQICIADQWVFPAPQLSELKRDSPSVIDSFLNNLLLGRVGRQTNQRYWRYFDRKTHARDLARMSEIGAAERVREDREHILALLKVERTSSVLATLKPAMREHRDLALEICSIDPSMLTEDHLTDENFALDAADPRYGNLLANPDLYSRGFDPGLFDTKFGLRLVERNWKYVLAKQYRNHSEVALAAIARNAQAYRLLLGGPTNRGDLIIHQAPFLVKAVQVNWEVFALFPARYRCGPIADMAFRTNKFAIEHWSLDYYDPQTLQAWVEGEPHLFWLKPFSLRGDLLLACICRRADYYLYAPEELKGVDRFITAAVLANWRVLLFLSKAQKTWERIELALDQDFDALNFLEMETRMRFLDRIKHYLRCRIRADWKVVQHPMLRNRLYPAQLALEQTVEAWDLIGDSLRRDESFVKKMLAIRPEIAAKLPPESGDWVAAIVKKGALSTLLNESSTSISPHSFAAGKCATSNSGAISISAPPSTKLKERSSSLEIDVNCRITDSDLSKSIFAHTGHRGKLEIRAIAWQVACRAIYSMGPLQRGVLCNGLEPLNPEQLCQRIQSDWRVLALPGLCKVPELLLLGIAISPKAITCASGELMQDLPFLRRAYAFNPRVTDQLQPAVAQKILSATSSHRERAARQANLAADLRLNPPLTARTSASESGAFPKHRTTPSCGDQHH